jgi:hypothetical protein
MPASRSQARQRQGDKATYHFIDNVARAIRYTGRILIDLIPKMYDTRACCASSARTARDVREIDPNQPHPVGTQGQPVQIAERQATPEQAAQLIYNPGIGRYDVTVEVGPNYETRRQEAFHALTQIMSPGSGADEGCRRLLFKAADFPMADDVAERLRRTIPPRFWAKVRAARAGHAAEDAAHGPDDRALDAAASAGAAGQRAAGSEHQGAYDARRSACRRLASRSTRKLVRTWQRKSSCR